MYNNKKYKVKNIKNVAIYARETQDKLLILYYLII